MSSLRPFLAPYEGAALEKIAFPVGGLGSGMVCLDGTGALSHWSLRHRPQLLNNPMVFSALSVRAGGKSLGARVLEGPVPSWKFFFPWDGKHNHTGSGGGNRGFGFPRFQSAQFEARFPFGRVALSDPALPVEVNLTAWNPFIPNDADNSSLPVASLEYRLKNTGAEPIEGVYSFHAQNFLTANYEDFLSEEATGNSVQSIPGGFHLRQDSIPGNPTAESSFAAWIDDPQAKADVAWFRGGWFDPFTILWKHIEAGTVVERKTLTEGKPSIGGSVYLPFVLAPGEEKTVRLLLAWHVPYSGLRIQHEPAENLDPKKDFYRPWYAGKFNDIHDVVSYWIRQERTLYRATETFSSCFYDSTLPPEVLEAVAANLSILKSPTVLRQVDGKVWAWEGTADEEGSCPGTCTHVWNYAQALPHLFPALERTLRDVEFNYSQDEKGHQTFRAALPIAPTNHNFHAAADGQLGGLMKVYRDWRISGDTEWLRSFWPRVRRSLEYCIETWDPTHLGALVEPHHNTYDIEFWGADGMCTSFYLAALQAAILMARALNIEVPLFEKLLTSGRALMENDLYNGEYFTQKIQWTGLCSPDPVEMTKHTFRVDYSTEALELLEKEGPKYQYGTGCISDGVLGEWMGWTAGLPPAVDPAKIEQHLLSVHRYNFRPDLSTFPNPQRPSYAFGHEGGLILCSWPKGGRLALPFVYSEEVWTGIEYHLASHLISFGHVNEGLEIVRTCRQRYDGLIRNPFDEIECGHWYARAMSSYALLQALSGARYDAVDKVLHLAPRVSGDFRSFLCTATGFGTVGVKDGQPFLDVKSGHIDLARIDYRAVG